MSSLDLRKLGTISLLDLDVISRFYGRDFLPYPFMFTQPSRFRWHDEYADYARSVPDRFNNGDLAEFQRAFSCYAKADIRVESHVQYIPADTASVRVVAARHGQVGFLAKQRPEEDAVDIYHLSPYSLGPAVADSAGLQNPGRRPAVIMAEHAPRADGPDLSDDIAIHHAMDTPLSAAVVAEGELTAFGTVQSFWHPSRSWGLDRAKDVAVWMRIKGDGDYLYTTDLSEAKPVSAPMLAERIDRLIADDIKALKRFRDG